MCSSDLSCRFFAVGASRPASRIAVSFSGSTGRSEYFLQEYRFLTTSLNSILNLPFLLLALLPVIPKSVRSVGHPYNPRPRPCFKHNTDGKIHDCHRHSDVPLFHNSPPYKTISNVPAPISAHPIKLFVVNSSCKNTKASTSVMITLSLSIGTTFDASPTCSAL